MANSGSAHHEGFEIIVLVGAVRRVVVRRPRRQVILGRRAQAEQHCRIQPALARRHQPHRAPDRATDLLAQPGNRRVIQQVGLVEHHHVGGLQLVLVDLRQRVVVLHRWVCLALPRDRVGIIGEPAGRHSRAVDHRDHPVHRHARAHLRPAERLQQRLRQRQPGGLDQDVLGRVGTIEQRLDGRQEIVGDGAAQAAVGQFDDVLIRATCDAATAQGLAVDAERAEFVDDDRDAPSAGVLQHVAHQRGLSRAEEAGDDGGGDFRDRCAHAANSSGGTRAITTLARVAGRRDGITVPVAEAA